jgi:hypothetical protein
LSKPFNISSKKTVLEVEGGPVNSIWIGTLDSMDFINSFFKSAYPTTLEKNLSSGLDF